MKGSSESLSKSKQIVFAFIPLIILLIITELGLQCVYYQRHSGHTFALVHAFKLVRYEALRGKAAKLVKNLNIPEGVKEALFSSEGKELLENFQKEYEDNFKILVEETNKIKSKLLVLYLPSGDYVNLNLKRDICRRFYSGLAEKYKVDFLDLTQEFLKYPVNTVTLLPENMHLSRFGNKLVTKQLAKYLDKYNDYRMTFKFQNRPRLFGDLEPNCSVTWETVPILAYKLVTNKQGLRMNYDLTFPKKKQRILVLGDSYTFGPFLANQHTYPNLLDAKYPDKEVINAGMRAYTITDEVSLFVERAKFVEPDITILQVLDNDLYDLFFFKRDLTGRQTKVHLTGREIQVHDPSKVEKEFLNKLGMNL